MQKQINPKKGVKLRFEATSWLPAKFSSQNNLLDHCNNNVLSLFTQGLLWDSSKEEQLAIEILKNITPRETSHYRK